MIRGGVKQKEPQSTQEILRQPLFGNPWITDDNGTPLGLEHGNRFSNWAAKGLQLVKHIWSEENMEWRTALDLLQTTKSWKTNALRTEIIKNIPSQPNQAPVPQVGH